MPTRLMTAFAALLLASSVAGAGVEPLTRTQVLTGAQISRPVSMTHAPGDYGRLFIVEQKPVAGQGRVRVLNLHTGQLLATAFVTVTSITTGGNEQGLLGLAFHPNYAENGYFFVYFTAGGNTVVRRYTVSSTNPNVADTSTAKTIITIPSNASNHNGGWIGFGPNGYLYIATGDGGGGGDPNNFAQNLSDLRGKMLRIDVDVPEDSIPYLIPPTNPFANLPGTNPTKKEIWASGLRNPWRSSFDRKFGDLYIGDVGQNAWEEVNFQHADSIGRENYGWKCYEGIANFAPSNCAQGALLTWPFHTYGIGGNTRCGVMGGKVYRGCNIPTLDGTYFFADHCSSGNASGSPGNLWSIKYDRDNMPSPSSTPSSHPVSDFTNHSSTLGLSISGITAFGEDARGEIYFATLFGGVYKIVPVTPTISIADLDCSGSVDVFDLLELLATWGPCFGCKADLNGDGAVDVFDLLFLLGEWG